MMLSYLLRRLATLLVDSETVGQKGMQLLKKTLRRSNASNTKRLDRLKSLAAKVGVVIASATEARSISMN